MLRLRLVPLLVSSLTLAIVGCSDSGSNVRNESDVVAGWGSYGGDPGGQRHSPLEFLFKKRYCLTELALTFKQRCQIKHRCERATIPKAKIFLFAFECLTKQTLSLV